MLSAKIWEWFSAELQFNDCFRKKASSQMFDMVLR